jgi:hypothetical protein
MSALMLAFGIYIIGVAVVLFIRPTSMFRDNGWREFGLSSTGNYTIFPFWMFTLLWAVFSYAIATLGTVFFANLALRSTVPSSRTLPKPISSLGPSAPGYYIVEPQGTAEAPKFVYFGTTPPTMDNLRAYSR